MTLNKKACDVCGSEYNVSSPYIAGTEYLFNTEIIVQERVNENIHYNGSTRRSTKYDLCPECAKELAAFIERKAK